MKPWVSSLLESGTASAQEPGDPALGRVALGLSAVVAFLVLMILLGWQLDIEALKSVVRGPVGMKPNGAVALLVLAAAVVLHQKLPAGQAVRRPMVAGLAACVSLFAMVSLTQDITGSDFGIDQWLFLDPDRSGRSVPGRVSPAAAYALIILGAALITLALSHSQRWKLPSVFGLSAAVVVVAVLAIGGRLTNNLLGSTFWNFTPIAFDTAICLLLLGIATFCTAWREGRLRWSIDAFTGSGFAIGVLSVFVTAGSTYYLARQLQNQVEEMSHAEEVIKVVEEIARDLAGTAAWLRGYVISGDDRQVDKRNQGLRDVDAGVLNLKRLLHDHPDQLLQVDMLEQAVAVRTRAGDRLIEVRRSSGFAAAEQAFATGTGATLTDRANALLAGLRQDQYVRLEKGRRLSSESARRTFLTMPLGAIISITLLMFGLFVLNRALAERQHTVAVLRERETLFRAIFEVSTDGILVTDEKGLVVLANGSAARMFGYTGRAMGGIALTALLPGWRDERSHPRSPSGQGIAEEDLAGPTREMDARRADHRMFKVEVSRGVFETSVGSFVARVVRDISARHEAQRKLQRLTNIYDALSKTNQALVHLHEETSLFQEICRICVEHGHSTIAFVALVDGDRITPRAHAGPAQAFLKNIHILRDPEQAHGQGPVATAVREGQPYICNDFFADSRTGPWRERAAAIETQSTAAFPIRRRGAPIGALSLHMRERNFFDPPLVALLTEMADDVSFALDNIDRERERTAAQAALSASELRMRNLFDQASDGILILTADHRCLDCNRAAASMLGYSRDEMLALNFQQVLAPKEQARLAGAVSGVLSGVSYLQEWECLRKDGSIFVGEVSARALDASSYLAIVRDLTERKRAERNLEHLATHDVLTDLPNQRLMHDRIARAVSQAKRGGRQIAVMYVDVDRFKVVNDAYGHAAGDALLVSAAKRLVQLVRDEDTVARQSGDEFVLLLSELRKFSDAYIVAQKVVDGFTEPFEFQGNDVPMGISIGVSVYPQDGEDAEILIGNAEVAMYRAKELGRGTYQFFTQEMSKQTREQVTLETGLRTALAQNELYLVYQPKVDLVQGRIVGSEALLRWTSPGLGHVSPGQFIPVAEESGLIMPIGEWALRTACRQAKEWLDDGLDAGVVSVNLSVRQFLRVNVVDWVLGTLAETGLDPSLLELELTESLIARDTEKVIETINRLKAAGVTISIDDFGTGYSSLAYLKRFKVNTLKIDQSFIRNMLKDPEDAVIPVAVISLAHALGLKVIAEGVETAEHCTFLRQHGCDQIQGYFFSRPVSAGDFGAMVARGRRLEVVDPPRVIDEG